MYDALVEIEMVPAEPERFSKSQPVGKAHEDQGGIAESPAPFSRGVDERLDLFWGEMLAFPRPASRTRNTNISFYAVWRGIWHGRNT